jgi:arabinose-5-phosphate isomerase
MSDDTTQQLIDSAQRTFALELDALAQLKGRLDDSFASACKALLSVDGRVIVTGMGKSGHIANKIAATLASTGTPAFYVHPAEASHGDMGMITAKDTVLALSNSGTTQEIILLLPLLKRLGITLIAMTGNPDSTLAQAADVHLYAGADNEACPLDLAPTSSTTNALVMGDAIAIALLEARGFTAEDFAFSHPGGALGKKLLLKVEDVMVSGGDIPKVCPSATLAEALMEITAKGLGMTTVSGPDNQLLGVFTDGDLRRALETRPDINLQSIDTVMSTHFKTIAPDTLAAEALYRMEHNRISALVVCDTAGQICGVVQLLGLLRAGLA